jgi:hypothetical protein
VPQATGHSGQSKVSLFRTITGGDVGTSDKTTNGPFQDPTQAPNIHKNGPFQCLKPQASSAKHKSVYFDQSQGVLWERPTSLQTALFRTIPNHSTNLRTAHFSASSHRPDRSITNQFISTNHRSVYSDQSQTTHQPSGPNKRKPQWPVKSV